MKTNLIRATLAFAALAVTSTAAMGATADMFLQLDGIKGIVVDRNTGVVAAQARTGADGQMTFDALRPGDYVLEIDGNTLRATMDRVLPSAPPPQKSAGPSVGLSLGGLFGGGGSSHSSGHQGIGETKDDKHNGERGMAAGVGLSIPVGGGGSDQPPGIEVLNWTWALLSTSHTGSLGPVMGSSFEMPYCRDTAGQGIRIGFRVPADTGPAKDIALNLWHFKAVLTVRKAGGASL